MADPSSRLLFVFGLLFSTLNLLNYPIICHAQTLFAFGDGLYDAGNKHFLTDKRVPANFPPYGITVGKATGRWSDGLIIPDYLAEFMGIPHIPPILEANPDLAHGASFAVADATVLGSPLATMTLSQQVMKFSQNKNKWTDEERSKAIYLFYIGGNDYLNYTKYNPNPSEEQKQGFVDQVISGTEEELKMLYGVGARKFAFQNLAPLGCLPVVKEENGITEECVKLPSQMAELHNQKLLQVLGKLARTLDGFQYSVYDFFSSIQKRVTSPKIFKFETGELACCRPGSFCSSNNICLKPTEYLFFDGKYLTQDANNQIAQLIWSADTVVINPNNLRELLVLPLDIPVIFGSIHEESVQNVPKDTAGKMHDTYDVRSLEWGMGSELSYIIEGVSSLII